jgi:hypothetical protein
VRDSRHTGGNVPPPNPAKGLPVVHSRDGCPCRVREPERSHILPGTRECIDLGDLISDGYDLGMKHGRPIDPQQLVAERHSLRRAASIHPCRPKRLLDTRVLTVASSGYLKNRMFVAKNRMISIVWPVSRCSGRLCDNQTRIIKEGGPSNSREARDEY